MGQNLVKLCCCEQEDKKLIKVPIKSIVNRTIYTLREETDENLPETENDNDNLNESVQTLREIKINKSIMIFRKQGLPSEEYIILEELGEGSFGMVVKVVHKITQNIRALKIINKLNLDKSLTKSKLYDEIKILKDIDHPNVIKIYEFFEDNENFYMITEYCPEGDLAKHTERMEYFNETIVKILMFQIISAVLYLHSKNIIHGDLKLENILIETLSMKTAKSFRSSITYDLEKMKNNYKELNKTNEKKLNKNHNYIENNNKSIKRSFIKNSNDNEIMKNKIENGLNNNPKEKLNEICKTNLKDNFLNEKILLNPMNEFEFNSINYGVENSKTIIIENDNNDDYADCDFFNLNKNDKVQKSINEKHERKDYISYPSFHENNQRLYNSEKNSDVNLLQRKHLFMKFNKEFKTLNTLSNIFSIKSKKNNIRDDIDENVLKTKNKNLILTEEDINFKKSLKINTDRTIYHSKNNINNSLFYKKDPFNHSEINIENLNKSQTILKEEDCLLENQIFFNNFLLNNASNDISNGAKAPNLLFKANQKLNLSTSHNKKINIPALNLKSIKNININNNNEEIINKNNENNYLLFSNSNNRIIRENKNLNTLKQIDTIEELDNQLKYNPNINEYNDYRSIKKNNNPNSKRTLNNSSLILNNSNNNQFETIYSCSNTMRMTIDNNLSEINILNQDLSENIIKNGNDKIYRNNNITPEKNNKHLNSNKKLELEGIYQFENVSNFEIKLIDFGCSKIFKKGHRNFKDLIGTLFYIAPEVIKNNYNEKCDLWSCGVIMYFLLVGFPPFFAMTDTEVFEQILSSDYTFNYPEFDNISKSAKDLIKKLLEVDPKKRLSAKEALDHEFFDEINSNRLDELNSDFSVLQNLKKNKNSQKFQQAVVSYLVYNFAKKDEIKNLRKVFKTIDINQDGRISKEELLFGMNRFSNLEITEKEIQDILDIIDSDKSGFLEYEEFIAATINKRSLFTDENLKAAFDLFDQDKNGNISTEEIKNILIGKENNIPEKVVKDLIIQINSTNGKDENKNQKENENKEITFEEFKKIIYQVICEE